MLGAPPTPLAPRDRVPEMWLTKHDGTNGRVMYVPVPFVIYFSVGPARKFLGPYEINCETVLKSGIL
jgi:hypothetical protein